MYHYKYRVRFNDFITAQTILIKNKISDNIALNGTQINFLN